MSPTQKKLLRDALLMGLAASAPVTLPAETLKNVAWAAGFRLTDDDLAREMDYLVKKGLAQEGKARLSTALKRWELTSDGTDYCEEEGLI